MVTDYATFAWVCDVFIAEAHGRGRGLGKWLIEHVVTHPDLPRAEADPPRDTRCTRALSPQRRLRWPARGREVDDPAQTVAAHAIVAGCQRTTVWDVVRSEVITMPIVDVEIVPLPEESMRLGLAAEIADRCGHVAGSPPGSTWIKLHAIPCIHYADNGGGPPEGVFPSSCRFSRPGCPHRTCCAPKSTAHHSRCRGDRPPSGDLHIVYLPAGAGRVAFGGEELVSAE